MNYNHKIYTSLYRSFIFIGFVFLFFGRTSAQDVIISVHLHGVYESKISLLPLAGKNSLKPVIEKSGVKEGESSVLHVPGDLLPGEFVLRFDYKQKPSDQPYPSEKMVIINKQNLDLWINPVYSNNPDSTWFQKDENENKTYETFLQENSRQKEKIGLLQNLLLNYDETESDFYRMTVSEYERRRIDYNSWVTDKRKQYKSLFASTLFSFQYLPQIDWKGNEARRKMSLRDHYLEEMDFRDTLIIRTSALKEWMNGYVNLFGELATSLSLRDSLFTLAGKTAIEKARTGHPLVYGWMVDYFFNGYESFNIEKGIKMLKPYLDDPDCLTSKRQEINKRLKGIETLLPGITAPNIIMDDPEGNRFELNTFKTGKKNILLLFWSADCNYCTETSEKLYSLYQNPEVQQILDIVAISIDETGTEIQKWKKKYPELKGWIHLRAADGLRSKAANDYYILGVPVMILIDEETKKIISMPEGTEQLNKLLNI